jgi:hypothetical protein
MRAVKALLIMCVLCLGTTAFADVYPLAPPPELFLNHIVFDDSGLSGHVQTITDINGCELGCTAGLFMLTGFDDSFSIYGSNPSDIYLQGTLIDAALIPGGEAGLLIQISFEDNAKWSALESNFLGHDVTASTFGNLVAMNIHNLSLTDDSNSVHSNDDSGDDNSGDDNSGDDHSGDDCHNYAYGDLGPVRQTPEPASLTLIFAGAAAGLLRKKLAA